MNNTVYVSFRDKGDNWKAHVYAVPNSKTLKKKLNTHGDNPCLKLSEYEMTAKEMTKLVGECLLFLTMDKGWLGIDDAMVSRIGMNFFLHYKEVIEVNGLEVLKTVNARLPNGDFTDVTHLFLGQESHIKGELKNRHLVLNSLEYQADKQGYELNPKKNEDAL